MSDAEAAMTQDERRAWLIATLLAEDARLEDVEVPTDADGQRKLLRALLNVREPVPASAEFLAVQDAYLRRRVVERGVAQVNEAVEAPGEPRIRLWRGDTTTLAADAIVNAANSQMLGCFVPGHHCIDNAIHTYAGVQLRLECARLMREQGAPEPTGSAKVTPGYNLPAARVIHTVGPIVTGPAPTGRDEAALRSCYRSVLAAADAAGAGSVAMCCISTGVFRYPNAAAAAVAVDAVRRYLAETGSGLTVVLNTFLAKDDAIYRRLLGL